MRVALLAPEAVIGLCSVGHTSAAPLEGHVRKRRTAAFAAGAAIVAVAGIAATAPAGDAAVATPAGATTPSITLTPGATHLTKAFQAAPTTAQCEADYQVACYSPQQLRDAYNLDPLYARGITGKGETIVIVDSYGSPTIVNDLKVFDKTFDLPAPPSFKVLTPVGTVPWDPTKYTDEVGWAGETTLDVQAAHAIAPGANIVLVETPVDETEGTAGFPQIDQAEEDVLSHPAKYGVTGQIAVISQSFSATEETFTGLSQVQPLRGAYEEAASKGVTVLAASGDSGAADVGLDGETYYTHPVTSWPDSDPLVTGVGGTEVIDSDNHYSSTTWNDTYSSAVNEYIYGDAGPNPTAGGGGVSTLFPRPAYQDGVQTQYGNHRLVPDVSMSAACSGLYDNYESFPAGTGIANGWYPSCGTSEATPLFSGIVALAAQVARHPLGQINPALYQLSAERAPGIVDITTGNNTVTFTQGTPAVTTTVKGFSATKGYDLATGVGTVNGKYFVPELAAAASPKKK
jgi:subtilase family serine protease